tara:strand:+ start:472 stop:951 length:480 start_codon:yes stop_codon:yes gene_type:complete
MPEKKRTARKKPAKKTATQPATTEDLQAVHDASVGAEAMGQPIYVAGQTLRPVTMETIVLLKQVDSPLILGKPIEDVDNIFLDCCIFVALQGSEAKEARRLAWNPDDLRDAALDLAATVPATEFQTFIEQINELLRDSTSTSVDAQPKRGDAADDPLGN